MTRSLIGSALVVFLAACGGGGDDADAPPATIDGADVDAVRPTPDAPIDAPIPDARPISRACPADPTEIPAGTVTISMSGVIHDQEDTGIAGATVDALAPGSDTPLGTTVSGLDGSFTVTVPVTPGGPPLVAYARVRHEDYVTNFIYPPDPLAENVSFDPIMFDATTLDLLYALLGDSERLPGHSTLASIIIDCEFQPVDGAVFTATPAPEDIIYLDTSGTLPARETDGDTASNGVAIAINVPHGTVAVGGTYGGIAFESHDVVSQNDGDGPSVTTTVVHPVPAAP